MFFRSQIIIIGTTPHARAIEAAFQRRGQRTLRCGQARVLKPSLVRRASGLLAADWGEDAPGVWLRALAPERGDRDWELVILPALGQTLEPPPQAEGLRVRPLSLEGTAARVLLGRYPLHFGCDVAVGQCPCLLLGGWGPLHRALVRRAMGLGQYGCGRLSLTVLCHDPDGAEAVFREEFPTVSEFCDVDFSPWRQPGGLAQTTLAFALEGDDPLETAENLRDLLAGQGCDAAPVLVASEAGDPDAPVTEWDGRLIPFWPLGEVCRYDLLFADTRDRLAQAIHNHYRDTIAAQGRDPASAPAGRPWGLLDESYREASRNQADHVSAKLAVIGAQAVPEEQAAYFQFTRPEVERLATIEHDRWAADRYLNGWRFGPQRDNEKKLHPDLVPFDALSEELKDLDRYAVRLIPALLGRQGREVRRDLVVGLDLDGGQRARGGVDRAVRQLGRRLEERFPEQALVVACRASSADERRIAAALMEYPSARLWMLFPDPLEICLNDLGVEVQRRSYLHLLARAERRVPLVGREGLDQWLRQRADVVAVSDAWGDFAVLSRTYRRAVMVDSVAGACRWGFEY